MKKSRFTEEQITFALRQADSGTPVADVCRQLGVSEATFEDARQRIEIWRQDYNQHRPHSSLGHLTPNEFAMQGQETALETAKL